MGDGKPVIGVCKLGLLMLNESVDEPELSKFRFTQSIRSCTPDEQESCQKKPAADREGDLTNGIKCAAFDPEVATFDMA
jgi:hypothetical protein